MNSNKASVWLFAAILLLCATFAHSQTYVRWDLGAPGSAGVTSISGSGLGRLVAVPNASIAWCNYPANAVPCTNFAPTYTTIASGITCPSNTPIVLQGSNSCVATSDNFGNLGLYTTPGVYAYTLTANGVTSGPFIVTIGQGGITGATPNGGTVVTGTTLGLLTTCSNNQVLQWNGTAWVCATIAGGSGCTVSPSNVNSVVFLNGTPTCATSLNFGYVDASAAVTVGANSTTGNITLKSSAVGNGNITLWPPLAYSFDGTIAYPNGSLGIGTGLIAGTGNQIDACAISSISRTTNVVTLTVNNNFCDYAANVWINVTGVTDSSFNGHFLLTAVSCCSGSAQQLTYSQTAANASSSGGHVALYVVPYSFLAVPGPLAAQEAGLFLYSHSITDAGNNPTGMRFFVGASSAGDGFGGGPIDLFAGDSDSLAGSSPAGDINLNAGSAKVSAANNRGGSINLNPGSGAGTGVTGSINLGGHLAQSGSGKFANSCTMSAGTTCTFSIGTAFASTPLCFASVQSAAPTTFQGSCAISGTTVTITASASNSNTWAALLIGNPN